MSTSTASSHATPPPSRRSLHTVSTSPPAAPVIRSASSARSALPAARATGPSGVSRRTSLKGPSGSLGSTSDSRDVLSASLKHETEQKEQLLVQLQNKDHTVATLTSENDNLLSSLNVAESRLNDLYADQVRMEEEMAARVEVSDKLRAQVRELEKEKRDLQRRYNGQTSTFEAERQAFYDNEQHLKSRIQSLTQARRQLEPVRTVESEPEIVVEETDFLSEPFESIPVRTRALDDHDSEPAEMTALRLELSTLSTSYSSLQSTLVLLQTQLVDLKRVNNHLQEENESYMILLREKTLSGQFDLMKQVGGAPSSTSGLDDDDDDDDDVGDENDVGSSKSTARYALDRVDEEAGEEQETLGYSIDGHATESPRRLGRHARRNGSASHSPSRAPRGESLADLPITGPGLDLAAELGRAENKDILSGHSVDERSVLNGKSRRKKSSSEARKVSSSESHDQVSSSSDIEALRTEVKSLRDANKALSLYASKIIDRIIAEEGFEHVLAVDYEKQPNTTTATPVTAPAPSETSNSTAPTRSPKQRPQSAIFGRASSNPVITSPPEQPAIVTPPLNPSSGVTTKTQRRSLSFDWKTFAMFGGNEKKVENLRPFTLKPGATSVTGARKLETFEDEEDRRERERLRATMKLMGIEKPAPSPVSSVGSPAAVPMQKSFSSPANPPVTATPGTRFSIFRSHSTTGHSDTSSISSVPSVQNHSPYGLGISGNGRAELTQEALEQSEAENTLASLDAHERNLSEEIARGGTGGFTELAPRRGLGEEWRSRRSKRSGGGSGSTVWSAGMSRAGDDPEA
ncbi:hypothetical protein PAXRUDRAFT_823214 [Paxillus rubicundulus Ve08.2h10]|uniref:Uncharacterized protein n=1 Tax=Paxillus rubicundulus Ve08.2h10 TaxID=930991 RepID=A0A0D0DKN1_9AGAM|nr:hypothetical protein PAXRUDRAFT_823214 [Paxillus rubicundulus Ve08.2h10]